MGVLIAIGQGVMNVYPPIVYTISVVGQPRDLTNWLANSFLGLKFPVTDISQNFPLLGSVGLIIGGSIGVVQSKLWRQWKSKRSSRVVATDQAGLRPLERRPRNTDQGSGMAPRRDLVRHFVNGFIITNFAMLVGYCPIRMAASIAYGSLFATYGLLFTVLGAFFGARLLVKRAKV